jgi:hypothetical protein
MFKKAYRYDDSVVFYFDSQDCKYVAKGGSLAWRLNNPGLISSHNPFAREFSAIGSCDQYAIFPSPLIPRIVTYLQQPTFLTNSYKLNDEFNSCELDEE